ncbi:MAG: histidine kinase N-terminal 7TM domain-containing protein [Anaerolineae bacterium]|nr:hypothetical protein [Anaerolineae bacterium]MDW8102486.1 histidine kinase N-terminal 7TM domain-containing protein [Anaerolineae bacterium]
MNFLTQINFILSAGIVLVAFSLLAYVASTNLRNPVARAFCAMMAFVIAVYSGDLVIPKVEDLTTAFSWLRFQWLGISFIPAAYFHFASAILRASGSFSSLRRWISVLLYLMSLLFCLLALRSDLLVYDGKYHGGLVHLTPGPIFPIFTAFFVISSVASLFILYKARQKAFTSTTRRRLSYLLGAFVGPGIGVFPYLLLSRTAALLSPPLVLFLSVVGNVIVALMLIVMAYVVAYYGALAPDRIIKHQLIHYLLRGPFVGICVIGVILLLSEVDSFLGLPGETATIFAVVILVVLLQILINKAKPFIDRLIYSRDRDEVVWIQELDSRLLTTTDLQQFLESILVALCELLKVRWGFVALRNKSIEARCGPLYRINEALQALPNYREKASPISLMEGFNVYNIGFWVIPLEVNGEEVGLLVIEAPSSEAEFSSEELEVLETLVQRIARVLEDRILQQKVFEALRHIIPDVESIRQWQASLYTMPAGGTEALLELAGPDYQLWVKEALSNYWVGPKLAQSPLLKLKVVEKALKEHDGNPVKALRVVLKEAIEALKPEGRQPAGSIEWVLYNILEMRYLQGKRPKEIAERLAISESDLYRKQRIAIEQVSKILAEMERREAYGNGKLHG